MARKSKQRTAAKRLIIICGTEKTEPIYFNSYKRHLRERRIHIEGIEVNASKTKVQAPDKLLEYTYDIAKDYDLDFKNGDTIWCVFDYDDFDKKIQSSIYKKKYKDINIIVSTRCFELWYILHFGYSASYIYSTPVLEKQLDQKLKEKYDKSKCYFKKLLPLQAAAIENAKKLEVEHKKNGINLNTKDANPYTGVYKLVEYLNNFK